MKEVWIGFEKDCIRVAGTNQIKIVSNARNLVGYKGPMRVHLCGDFEKLSTWPTTKIALCNLESGGQLEKVYHA